MADSVEVLKENREEMYGPWMEVSYGKSRNGSEYLGWKNFNGQNGRADNGARPGGSNGRVENGARSGGGSGKDIDTNS
ncbi:hypothetical protein ACOSQ2_006798 [Xanthoceras sorbifolium]